MNIWDYVHRFLILSFGGDQTQSSWVHWNKVEQSRSAVLCQFKSFPFFVGTKTIALTIGNVFSFAPSSKVTERGE